jgi:predicted nucleic acid-binding protein
MNVLLDTNIVGRMAETGHVQHRTAVDAVAALVARGDTPCLVPQVLYEFWVVATRPLASNGLGCTPAAADAELSRLNSLYPLLPDTPSIFPAWRRLVASHSVLGKAAHDARLVAATIVHGVSLILTFNVADFSRFPHITVLDPAALATSPTP